MMGALGTSRFARVGRSGARTRHGRRGHAMTEQTHARGRLHAQRGRTAAEAEQEQEPASNSTPVLIFIPGLGTSPENTADVVADVIAENADRRDRAGKYKAETALDVVTPTGLTVSKRVTAPDGSTALQLFQLSYRTALDESTTPFAPSVGPGAVRATTIAVVAGFKWWAAARRPGKGKAVKAQLFALFLLLAALLFAAAVALAALLVALGVPLGRLEKVFGTDAQAGAWTLGLAAFGTITWTALRRKILGLAKLAESLVHFVGNDDQLADDLAKRLDNAINDLTDAGWTGPIHLLGYSFGSLVVYEAMFPRVSSGAGPVPAQAVQSLTTIGCPLDIVRLYEPDYVKGRAPQRDGIAWKNVFNPADIMSSNLMNGSDTSDGESNALDTGSAKPESIRYLDQDLGLTGILVTGRMHASYWRRPDKSNCFEPLVGTWIPSQVGAPANT